MSYSYFAQYYDALTENACYEQRAEYLLQLFQRCGHAPGVTLDLACGTGTLTLLLKQRGVDIFGVDASPDMLSEAQQKTAQAGENVLYICQKMQELHLPGMVDTVICTLDSVNHITSPTALQKVFFQVGKYLSGDGLFIFDANTVYKHREILGDNCYLYDVEQVFCAWQNNYDPDTHKVRITLDFFEPENGLYRRSTEQFSEKAYTREEMTGLLGKAGLEIAAVYEDMTFQEPTASSQKEIYVVRRMRS